jgi:SAM-dependent methyltransferase
MISSKLPPDMPLAGAPASEGWSAAEENIDQGSAGAQEFVRQDCPGCGATDWRTVGSPVEAFAVEVGGREFWQPRFRAYRCNECDLVFKSSVASPAILTQYYDAVDFRKWETPRLLPTEERVLNALKQLPAGSEILDFGCSTGRLLSHLAECHRCFGFEINSEAAGVARAKGISILDEQELFERKGRFDAVVLVDVYEHLAEPTSLLERLAATLKAGGILIVCTGNADARAVKGDPATYWYFQNVEHLNMITRGHAEYLAGQMGMRLIRWEAVCHYRPSPLRWLREWARSFAYEVFHASDRTWLRPVLRLTPALRRAEQWTSRPARVLTADHVIAVWKKD